MKKSTVVVSLFAFVIAGALVSAASTSHAADGKQLFIDQKCNKCHSIKSKGVEKLPSTGEAAPEDADAAASIKPPDLSDVKLDVATLKPFLKKETEITFEGKSVKHKKKVELSEDDLVKVINYVLSK